MKFSTFIDYSHYNVSLKYPHEWEQRKAKNELVVVFLSPKESESDLFRENLSVMIKKNPYQTQNINLIIDFEIENLKNAFLNFILIEKSKNKLSKISGYRLVYSGKKKDITFKIMQYYVLKGKRIYLITYTAQQDKFLKYKRTIKKIVKSFKIL